MARVFFINKQITEDIVLDINKEDKLVGIEILNASKRIDLEKKSPLKYKISIKSVSWITRFIYLHNYAIIT